MLEILVFAIRSPPFEERLATTEKATRTNTSRITRRTRARSDINSGICFAVRNDRLNRTVSGRHLAPFDPNHRDRRVRVLPSLPDPTALPRSDPGEHQSNTAAAFERMRMAGSVSRGRFSGMAKSARLDRTEICLWDAGKRLELPAMDRASRATAL